MSVHSETTESPRARTLEDVARLAGVSRNTVSLAIRLSPRVNPVTRDRVLRIVRETGYRPNYAARALAGRRTTTVGLVRYGSSRMQGDSFYDLILAGLRHALGESDYDLLLFAPGHVAASHDLTEPITSGRVDGMVIIGTQTDRAAVAEAHRQGVAIVHVGRRDFGVEIPTVSADEVGGLETALAHLRGHGHRRIAMLAEDLRFEPTRDKVQAYRRLMRDAGAEMTLALDAGQAEPERIRDAVRQILEQGVTAAITTRDPLAVALIRGLREQGVRTPEQFAVIAYDNLEWSPLVEPPLTCVSPPRYDMGAAAGRMIVNLIEGREVRSPQVLPTQMVTRRSCGCDWSPLDERRDT
ncbi:MAG: LacI family DNA-binding transcriptional regulator [Chloroflexi bacterium]|nr:LacI family DNA-binding transcriptional regulator [Chloroflexota bacterium]